MWVPIEQDEFLGLFAMGGDDLVSTPGAMTLSETLPDNTHVISYHSVIWKLKGKEYLLVQVIAGKPYHSRWDDATL